MCSRLCTPFVGISVSGGIYIFSIYIPVLYVIWYFVGLEHFTRRIVVNPLKAIVTTKSSRSLFFWTFTMGVESLITMNGKKLPLQYGII